MKRDVDPNTLVEALGMVTKVISTQGGGAILVLGALPPAILSKEEYSSAGEKNAADQVETCAINDDEELKVVISRSLMPNEPRPGEILRVSGKIITDPVHGRQMEVCSFLREPPVGAQIIPFLALNSRFAGIRHPTAIHLWETYEGKLYDLLNRGDIDALVDREGGKLPYRVALNLCAIWEAYIDEKPVLKWLQENGFPRQLVTQIREFYGREAIEILTEDPYRMLAFAPWKTVDKIAVEKLGIKNDDPRRLAAGMEAVLYMHYDRGHTAVSRVALRRDMHKKLGLWVDPDQIYDAWKDRAVELVNEGLYQSVGAYAMEEHICHRIQAMASDAGRHESLFKPVFDPAKLKAFESTNRLSLTQEQQDAVKMVLNSQISCILGQAGTGKSTVTSAIHDQLGSQADIFQIALTGRAAKCLHDATNREALTCAAFLNRAYSHPLPRDMWLFIDESSMLDAPMTYRIFDVLPQSANVCLMGDHYQLAGIGPGLILHHLAWSKAFANKVELTEVHRQKAETEIPQIAKAIRERTLRANQLDEFQGLKIKDYGVSFIEANSPDAIMHEVKKVYRQCRNVGEVQIVAARNATCDMINKELHDEFMEFRKIKGLGMPVLGGATLDEPILHHSRNDYDRNIFNGSIGVLKSVYGTPRWTITDRGEIAYIAEADFDGAGIIQLSYDDFDFIRLGYAISVHKAQGSQFKRVIVISEHAPMVDNTWFYTAITRARQQVIVIGSRNLFNDRVSREPHSFSRCTGMYL